MSPSSATEPREGGKVALKTVKVREETYRRLLWYKHVIEMNLLAEGEVVKVTMDDVISTLIALVESAKIKVAKPKAVGQAAE